MCVRGVKAPVVTLSLEERVNTPTNLKLGATGNMYFILQWGWTFSPCARAWCKTNKPVPHPREAEWCEYFILTQIDTFLGKRTWSILQWLPAAQKDCLRKQSALNYGLGFIRMGTQARPRLQQKAGMRYNSYLLWYLISLAFSHPMS